MFLKQEVTTKMQFRFAAGIAALIALAAPATAFAAEDTLSYEKLTHCAAFNMLLSQVMSVGEDKDKAQNKAQAETFAKHSAALMVVATVSSKKDIKLVQGDVATQNDAMIKSLGEAGAADRLVSENLETCSAMGQAAFLAIEEATAKK